MMLSSSPSSFSFLCFFFFDDVGMGVEHKIRRLTSLLDLTIVTRVSSRVKLEHANSRKSLGSYIVRERISPLSQHFNYQLLYFIFVMNTV